MTSPQPAFNAAEDTFPLRHKQAEAALAAAALDAIRENQRFGLPVISTENGKIVHVDPFEAEERLLKAHPTLATQKMP